MRTIFQVMISCMRLGEGYFLSKILGATLFYYVKKVYVCALGLFIFQVTLLPFFVVVLGPVA